MRNFALSTSQRLGARFLGIQVTTKTIRTYAQGASAYCTSDPYWPNLHGGGSIGGSTGFYHWLDANGGDSIASKASRVSQPKRWYTTVNRNGKVEKRYFVERPHRRTKKLPPNDYTITQTRINWGRTGNVHCNLDVFPWYSGNWVNANYSHFLGQGWRVPAPNPWTANDDINLINKLAEKIKGSDFNAAVMLGEANQTLRMIGDRALSLAQAIRYVRKGRMSDAARVLTANRRFPPGGKQWNPGVIRGDTASLWLELQYGWMPLLKDIKSGAELVAHQVSVPFKQRYVVRKKINTLLQNDAVVTWRSRSSFTQCQLIAIVSEAPTALEFSGLLDPELVAWELTPFSFVADWFIPFGDYLAARAAAGRMSGTFIKTRMSNRMQDGAMAVVGLPGASFSDYFYSEHSMTRTVTNSLSVPLPVFKGLGQAASWQHCANALALATVAFRGTSQKTM